MSRAASILACAATVLVLGAPQAARAQTVDRWTAIQQLQADLKADRQAVVAENLPLTEAEARAFWPLYKTYRGDVEKIGERLATLIQAYASSFETMTDAKADAFFKDSLAIDRDRVALRETYVPKVRAVLPAQKAARFFQIENKLDAIVNLTLASEIPLVPLKK
jgi:predicted trehalose synthase